MNEPTFKRFMYQKNVDSYINIRDTLISKGMDKNKAISLAAETIKNTEALWAKLGTNKNWEDIFQAVFLARKYREALVGKGVGIVKSFTTQIKNPAFEQSRALGLGIVAMYAAYNVIQQKLTHNWLWQNPAGKEFELVIPDKDDPTKYISIPFMPSSTAIYRRGAGTVTSLAKGDPQEAGKQFSGLFSMPISQYGQIASNRDYWGNEIRNPNRPKLIEGLPLDTMQQQLAAQVIKAHVPGSIEQPIQYAQDKKDYEYKKSIGKNVKEPSVLKYVARGLEIPIKQGSFPNPYYKAVEDTKKQFDADTISAFEKIHPKTDPFLPNEGKTEMERVKIATERWSNPNLVIMERQIAKQTAQTQGKPLDPIYSFPLEDVIQYYNYQRLPQKSQERKNLLTNNPNIVKLMEARSQHFAQNPIPNSGVAGVDYAPQPSAYVQAQMDAKN
jgi:hypothetical protein